MEVVGDDVLPRVVVVDRVAAGQSVSAPLAQAHAVTPAFSLDDEDRPRGRAGNKRERAEQSDQEGETTL